MSYTVLARRYRPQNFDEVIGQDAIAQTLKNAIKTDRVPHAYLFTGTRGVGKTTMARIVAKALNCLKADEPTTEPCCKCEGCLAINTGEDIDVIEIDGASHTGVDDIRELRENALYRPARARYKIYIIDEVHMLSASAFNALLKILEEPPGHIKFIFATTEPNKILPTIQSRCQRFDFANVSTKRIAEYLKSVLEKEKIKFEEELVLGLARMANGSVRDGLSLLDQLISTGLVPLKASMLEEFLGEPDRRKIHNLAEKIASGSPADTLEAADHLLTTGHSPVQLVVALIDYMRDLMVLRAADSQSELLTLTGRQRQDAAALAEKFDLQALIYNITALEKLRWVLRNTDSPRPLLEASLLRLTLSEQFIDATALAESLKNQTSPLATGIKKKPVAAADPAGTTAAAAQPAGAKPAAANRPFKPVAAGTFTTPPGNDPGSLQARWQAVLDNLNLTGPGVAAKLSGATPTTFTGGVLTLSFPASAAIAIQLCRSPDAAEKIEVAVSKVFASPVKINFTTDDNLKTASDTSQSRPPGARTSQKSRNEILNHPAVKTVLAGLEATVTSVEEV